MPNSKSAEKRLRQSKALNLRHRATRTAIRSQVKKVRQAISDGDQEACQTEFRLATKKLDQAAAKHIIHKNAAARTKSRLVKAIKAVAV